MLKLITSLDGRFCDICIPDEIHKQILQEQKRLGDINDAEWKHANPGKIRKFKGTMFIERTIWVRFIDGKPLDVEYGGILYTPQSTLGTSAVTKYTIHKGKEFLAHLKKVPNLKLGVFHWHDGCFGGYHSFSKDLDGTQHDWTDYSENQ